MLWLLAAPFPVLAQTNAPSTNAPAATPPAPIDVSDVVTLAQAANTQLKTDQNTISPDLTAQSARDDLAELSKKIDNRLEADQRFEQSNPTLGNLQTSQAEWQSISDALDGSQNSLSIRVRELNTVRDGLDATEATWKATRTSARNSNVPAVIQSIDQVLARIGDTRKDLQNGLNDLYTLQKQVADQSERAKTGLESVNRQFALAQEQLFQQTHPHLWDPTAFTTEGSNAMMREKLSLQQQVGAVKTYLGAKVGAVLLHVLLLALLIATFLWIRNVTREHAKTEEGLREAERIFDAPFSTALILTLFVSNWFYPVGDAPRLLWSAIGVLALAPTTIIVRRLVSSDLMPLLYATVAAYFVDQIRYAATPVGVFARFVFLAELLAVCIIILLALRSRKLCVSSANPGEVEKIVRGYLHASFFVFFAAGFANVLGYVKLSFLIGDGMLESSYIAVVIYAAVKIVDAVILALMSLRPLSTFGMIRRHHDLVYGKVTTIIRWIAALIWAQAALQRFFLRDPIWNWASDKLSAKHSWGSIKDIELGSILAFPITVWAAFTLSRLIRFALSEDVYPNLNLPRGIPYAISTVVHYAVLVVGFFLALSAMGIDLGNYAVLAGAFGVGLGFGLQNIMNNFMSGLILLFERPIKVGDTVQIDANTIGKVERIGIRASVILLTNGSELIMPNGNLISNPVTNWTLSNCERLIEIPVNIAPKADANRALDLLIAAAKAHAAVLKNPPPSAIILGIAAASTSLKLRCWIDSEEVDWTKVTTDLSLAVQAALEKENIPLA
jgi:small-conductance mechanosensitive channel